MARNRIAGWDTRRRRSPRLPIDSDGRLIGRQARPVKILDLSPAGCLVRLDAPLDAGAILDLELSLGSETVTTKVRVSNASIDGAAEPGEAARFLTGLSFLGLSAREQAAVRRFLDDERRRRRSADAAAR